MILSVSGFHCSGSSAVSHLLKEYDETHFVDFECPILDMPDGICALDGAYHAGGGYFREDRAYLRFLTTVKRHRYMQNFSKGKINEAAERYIDAITGTSWVGRSVYDYCYKDTAERLWWYAKRVVEKLAYGYKHTRLGFTNRTMRIKNPDCDFYEETRKFMDEAITLFGGDLSKINVMDQMMPPVNTGEYLKYVHDGKAIVVDRDPRDMFLNLQLGRDCRVAPHSAKEFVEYHKIWWQGKNRECDAEKVLHINFEDLIYYHDSTVKKIESFLGISKRTQKGKMFHPEKSIQNTQIFKRVKGYEADIAYIEKELADCLYNFPEGKGPDISTAYEFVYQNGKDTVKWGENL